MYGAAIVAVYACGHKYLCLRTECSWSFTRMVTLWCTATSRLLTRHNIKGAVTSFCVQSTWLKYVVNQLHTSGTPSYPRFETSPCLMEPHPCTCVMLPAHRVDVLDTSKECSLAIFLPTSHQFYQKKKNCFCHSAGLLA